MEATPQPNGPQTEWLEAERDGVCGEAVTCSGSLLRAANGSGECGAAEEDEDSDVEKDSGYPPPAHGTGVSRRQLCSSRVVEQGSQYASVCRAEPTEDRHEEGRGHFYQQHRIFPGSGDDMLTGSERSTLLPVTVSQHSTRKSAPMPALLVQGQRHRQTQRQRQRQIAGSYSVDPARGGDNIHVMDILSKIPQYSSLDPEHRLRFIDSQRHPQDSDHPEPQSRTDTRRYDVRLSTFRRQPHKWPLEQPSAERLAQVGFTYKGMEDTVVCHMCSVELSEWAEPGTPEPLLRHYTASPNCPFILQAFRDQLPGLRAQQDSQRSKYANTSARLHSFSSWPFSDIVTSYQLASVGFYYTGEGAKVICFSCGISISEWRRGDVPLLVHRNRSPHCQFLISIITKGSSSPSPSPSSSSSPSQQPMPRLKLLGATGSSAAASRPDWSNPQTRLKSFKKLSPAFPVSREELADAGLYLQRLPDVMKCFSCSAVVERWVEGDTAVEKHREVSPHCKFLSQTHPSKLYQQESPIEPTFDPSSLPAPQFDEQTLERMAQETQRADISSLPSPVVYQPEMGMATLSIHDDSTLPSSATSHPSLPSFVSSHPSLPSAASTSTYLSLPSSLSTHHYPPTSQSTPPSSLSTHPSPSSPYPSLLPSPHHQYPPSTDTQPLSLSATLNPSPHLRPPSEGSVSPNPASGLSSARIMGKSVSLPPSYHSRPQVPDTPLTYPMVEQPSSLQAEQPYASSQPAGAECVVCMDRPLEMVLVPCGHICVCEICSTQITRCPMCRTRKQMSVKVYYPY